MKTTLLVAAAALALGIGSAFAGEARYEPFGHATDGAIGTVTSLVPDVGSEHYPGYAYGNGLATFASGAGATASLATDVGSERFPAYAYGNGLRLNQAALLPTNGSNGIVQTANSLPSAPAIGGRPSGLVAKAHPAFGLTEPTKDYAHR